MSTHGKVGLGSFIALFVLTRVQTILLQGMQPGTWTPVITAAAISFAGLAFAVAVFVCFWLRIQSAKRAGGVPVPLDYLVCCHVGIRF